MTAARDLDRQLASWLDDRAAQSVPDGLLARSLARVDVTRQRPGWLVRDRGRSPGATAGRAARGRVGRLLAIAVVAILVVTAAGLFLKFSPGLIAGPSATPSLEPAPSTSPSIAPSPSQAAASSLVLRAGSLIAYIRTTEKPNNGSNCGMDSAPTCRIPRLWIVGTDGSNAHELLPDGAGAQTDASWSPDGARLLYRERGTLYLTDTNGSELQVVDTGCVAPCRFVSAAAFSADGTKLVFLRESTDAAGYDGSAAIAIKDLVSGRVTELSSTYPAGGMLPGWSPDGSQIVFFRYGDKDMGGPIAPAKAAVFVVDADGQNLHQVSPTTLAAQFAGWSPDGSRILFTSPDPQGPDIYTVRPDGTDLLRLTTDATSYAATWTPDGRILFARSSGGVGTGVAPAFWTMDADGANAAELIPGAMAGDEDPQWTQGPAWQPVGGPTIVPLPWNPSTATAVGPPPPTPPPTPTPALSSGFSPTGALPTTEGDPTTSDTATRLADGRVLVTMGCSTAAELYDPSTGTFSQTGSLAEVHSGKTATLLQDGRVLVVGGYTCVDGGQERVGASAELYDPATGTFSPTGSMRASRSSHTATLLADGRVLITGGNTQSPTGSRPIVLASYRTAATAESSVLASAELYDPVTGTFSPTGSMRFFRNGHTATLLGDGRVLVVGGGGEGYASRTEVELYDPATGTFGRTGSLKHGRWLHTATLLPDGRVLIGGGRSPKDSTYASTELYDPTAGTFTASGSMQASRQQHTATLLSDGRVLVTGGYQQGGGSSWDVLSSAELYDVGTGKFIPAGSMGAARMQHVATLLVDGRVLIAGGTGIGAKGLVPLTSAVLYQP